MAGFPLIPKDDPRQASRLRRYFFVVLTSLIVLFFITLAHIQGFVELRGLQLSALGMFLCFAVFYALIRSGWNLRAHDPSLTGAQIVSAISVIIVTAYYTNNEARGIYLPVLLMIFYFGIYRLNRRQMIHIALATIAGYAAMTAMLHAFRPAELDLSLESLRWGMLAVALVWFAQLCGHVTLLRQKLSDRKDAIEALLERDDLTGAGNRRFLTHMLEQEKSRADRVGSLFCVAMLDLDFFKKVNDTYGHQAGDQILKVFTQVAQDGLRKIDYFGRYGGEEFMLIMSNTGLDGAKVRAERLRSNVESARYNDIDPALIQTVSIGIAEYRRGESIAHIQLRADKAMYKAKSKGRNRIEIDDGEAQSAAADRVTSRAG